MQQQCTNTAILPCGDAALTVEFGQTIDICCNALARALDTSLHRQSIPGIRETMHSYGSVLVSYDPVIVGFAALGAALRQRIESLPGSRPRETGWRIPVAYGGERGFDLVTVAQQLDLAGQEVVHRHIASVFQVFMIGFLPGFTYLGGLDTSIAVPRRATPRAQIPAGSIVIGGIQSAVASIAGPSGWHVIGQTPVRAFMPRRDPVVFMMPGDKIVFEQVSSTAFDALSRDADAGLLVAEPIL
jgi:KipI family sensor histidine kinase inhibitor